jgi:hypothetical protein
MQSSNFTDPENDPAGYLISHKKTTKTPWGFVAPSALGGGGWSMPRPCCIIRWKYTWKPRIRDWVYLRVGQDGCIKPHPPPGFDHRIVQAHTEMLYLLSFPGPRYYFLFSLSSTSSPPTHDDQCTSLPSLSSYNTEFLNLSSLGPNIFVKQCHTLHWRWQKTSCSHSGRT